MTRGGGGGGGLAQALLDPRRAKAFLREAAGLERLREQWREGQPPLFSPEYEDCARVARENNVALREVYAQAQRAYEDSNRTV